MLRSFTIFPDTPASKSGTMEKKRGLTVGDLNDALFREIASSMNLELISWKAVPMEFGQSGANFVMASADEKDNLIEGHYAFDIVGHPTGVTSVSQQVTKQVLLRAKAVGEDIISTLVDGIGKHSKEEGNEFGSAIEDMFRMGELRDVQIAKAAMHDSVLQAVMPEIYFAKYDREHNIRFFVMERFHPGICSHIDCIEGGTSFGQDTWTREDINHVIIGIAKVHARFLDNIDLLPKTVRDVLLDGTNLASSTQYMKVAAFLFRQRRPEVLSEFASKTIENIANAVPVIEKKLQTYPKTLVHNDFNARNVCLRRNPGPNKSYLCAYDWETATLLVPQYDIALFLVFALPVEGAVESILFHLNIYHECLLSELKRVGTTSKETLRKLSDKEEFLLIFDYCMMEILSRRMMLYHSSENATGLYFPYLKRVINNVTNYLKSVVPKHTFLQ